MNDDYRSRVHAMLASTITRETHKGSHARVLIQFEDALFRLNYDIIEDVRIELRDSGITYTNNAVLQRIRQQMGWDE